MDRNSSCMSAWDSRLPRNPRKFRIQSKLDNSRENSAGVWSLEQWLLITSKEQFTSLLDFWWSVKEPGDYFKPWTWLSIQPNWLSCSLRKYFVYSQYPVHKAGVEFWDLFPFQDSVTSKSQSWFAKPIFVLSETLKLPLIFCLWNLTKETHLNLYQLSSWPFY